MQLSCSAEIHFILNDVIYVTPCMILQPELEMVARGLEKLLKFEQREILMNMLTGVCSEESHRSAAEALGLLSVSVSSLSEFCFPAIV